jgi:hypothetical protein
MLLSDTSGMIQCGQTKFGSYGLVMTSLYLASAKKKGKKKDQGYKVRTPIHTRCLGKQGPRLLNEMTSMREVEFR